MKHIGVLFGMVTLLICTGFGGSSESKPEKHHLNYYGHIIDLHGKSIDVDNISISGKLHAIKMYDIPVDATHDPAENTTAFDLEQIYSIEPAPKEKCGNNHNFKSKQYQKIVVTLNDAARTEKWYLIELAQKITCDEVTGAGPLERAFSFSGLKKLVISGKVERTYKQLYPQEHGEKNNMRLPKCH